MSMHVLCRKTYTMFFSLHAIVLARSSLQNVHGGFGGKNGQNTQERRDIGQNTP